MKRLLVTLLAVGCVGLGKPRAQMRVVPVGEQQGHIALGLALRHLSNAGIFMMATAHPDDENNGLLVMLNRGQGYRTALATATRGNGGQNEIGPEIFEALGVLRTEELAAIHRFDGAEQYFTRAVDFGFSFSVEETFEKWGRDEIVGDFVRLIRTVRPDVITGLMPTGDGGGQHHQASAILAREAFKAAADPTRYPEQIAAGLRPWQPKKFYFAAQVGTGRAASAAAPQLEQLTINLSVYDRLLGKTFAEIGAEARSMHKCQGTAQLLSLPGPATASYQLTESTIPGQIEREEVTLFDGVNWTIAGLAQHAGGRPPKALTDGLKAIDDAVQQAQKRFDSGNDVGTLAPLQEGLTSVRALRAVLRSMQIPDAGKYEIEFRLRQKEREFQQAIVVAGGIRVEALADDGVVVPGQPLQVSLLVANRGPATVSVGQIRFDGFEGAADCVLTAVTSGRGRDGSPPGPPLSTIGKDQVGRCAPTLRVPTDARVSEPYWHRDGESGRYTFDDDAPFGLPFRPTPFYAQVSLKIGDAEEIIHALPVEHRYQGDVFSGEKRSELLIVPALSVRVTPEVAVFPHGEPLRAPSPRPVAAPPPARGRGVGPAAPVVATPPPVPQEREVRATIVNGAPNATQGVVRLELPAGWSATPGGQPINFSREDEAQTVRFQVRPSAGTPPGEYRLKAIASVGDTTFDRGYQVIEYPHIRRQHIVHTSVVRMKVVDVAIAPNLTLGYIMGVGDAVPAALEQLGVKVEPISADDLAWGDLSRFSTIVTGVRAYERRADLRANNSRLIDYVRNGGTLVVQYNKFEFNDAQYGPYAAKVSDRRATDERAPVRLLAPGDRLFNVPNKITDSTWSHWVQERGLYFLGEHDSRYRELLAIDEPVPNNQGEKLGALVTTQYGRGHWVYVGLGLWRELPAGVDGAYQLLANLVSLGH